MPNRDAPTLKFKCISVRSRSDLGLPENQDIIAQAIAAKQCLRCACGGEGELKLVPHPVPGCGWGLKRYRINDRHAHAMGCPFSAEKLEPVFEPSPTESVVYTLRMLMEEEEGVPAGAQPEDPAKPGNGNGLAYGDFTHYFQAQFTRATLLAFAAANAGKTFRDLGIVNPTRDAIFGTLVGVIDEPLLRHRLSLAAGLQKLGLKLFWGLTAQPLVWESDNPLEENEVLEFIIGPHWEYGGFQPVGALLEISPKVLANSRGKAKANLHVIPPPYLYAAVARPEGGANRVTHFFRIPVVCAGRTFFPIESRAEGRVVSPLAEADVAILKLHVSADLRVLGQLWPFPTGHKGRLSSRPDMIAFVDGQVRVTFLTDSGDKDYHRKVDQSVSTLQACLPSPDVLVQSLPARSFSAEPWRKLLKLAPNADFRPDFNSAMNLILLGIDGSGESWQRR